MQGQGTFLSADELQVLTGYVASKQQAAYLDRQGIKHLINAAGKVIVLRKHIEAALGMRPETRKEEAPSEPNWGAI